MNFEKAMKELHAGKKIRRKEWPHLSHLKMVDNEVVAFQGEITNFREDPSILISDGWSIVDGDGTEMTFMEAIEHLKAKKCLRQEGMHESFIFIDNDSIVMCTPMQFDFMPTWKCINATDWESIK